MSDAIFPAPAKKSSPLTTIADAAGVKKPSRVGDWFAPLEGGVVRGLSFRRGMCAIHELSVDEPSSKRRDTHCRRYGITRMREV